MQVSCILCDVLPGELCDALVYPSNISAFFAGSSIAFSKSRRADTKISKPLRTTHILLSSAAVCHRSSISQQHHNFFLVYLSVDVEDIILQSSSRLKNAAISSDSGTKLRAQGSCVDIKLSCKTSDINRSHFSCLDCNRDMHTARTTSARPSTDDVTDASTPSSARSKAACELLMLRQ